MDYKNKKVLVCGIARSGISAAHLLIKSGAQVIIQDIKNKEQLVNELQSLNPGIKTVLGKNPDEALLSDIDLLVVSPGIPSDLPFLQMAWSKSIPVISEIELASSVCKAAIIAITGTNGKTTATTLTGEIFKSVSSTEILGNIGDAFSNKALDLSANDYAVVEVSSFQLENIKNFKPKAAAVLNISPDHLDRHKTMDIYISIKERIFENQGPDDYLILNYDDPVCKKMSQKANSKTILVSQDTKLEEGVYIKNKKIVSCINNIYNEIISLNDIKIGGRSIDNFLVAAAIALCFGIPVSNIAGTFKNFKGLPHRLEYIGKVNDVEFYNDSKATNTEAAVNSLLAMKRPVVLICGGYDKNADFTEWVKMFEKKVRHVVALGNTADKIIEVCKFYNFLDFEKANSLEEAVTRGFSWAIPGDALLLSPACASWDMFSDFEERGNKFRRYVLDIIERQ